MATKKKAEREFLEQLDFSRFPEKDAKACTEFRDVLAKLDPESEELYLQAVQKLPDGVFDNEHFMVPARYCMIAWGRKGVDALYRMSIEDPIDAGHDAGQALLAVATGNSEWAQGMIWLSHRYLDRPIFDRLVSLVHENCGNPEVQSHARRALAKVIRHYAADPANRPRLGIVLAGLTFIYRDDSPQAQLLSEIMATATLSISDELCDQAEDLVRQDLLEKPYQDFFERNPSLLDALASSVVPRQALADLWKTDFVIKRFDEQYLFVELEKPRDLLFTTYPQPSPALSHALGQVMSWFAWVDDNLDYAQKHGFPNIHRPRGLVVIGRDAGLNDEQRRMLRMMNDLVDHRIQVWTYDELIKNARNIVRNLTSR